MRTDGHRARGRSRALVWLAAVALLVGCRFKTDQPRSNIIVGESDCGGAPVACGGADLSSDIANCGACGRACDQPLTTFQCVDGHCQVVACADGAYDADGDPRNGCEYRCKVRGNDGPPNGCNGLDDDCNGIVDDGCGACGPEICNGLDDDCNGTVDDGAAQACPALPGGISACQDGHCALVGCMNGAVDLDRDPLNGCECQRGAEEICNDGKDNDCDGLIDYKIEDGHPVPCQRCVAQPLLPQDIRPEEPGHCGTMADTCEAARDGGILLTFCADPSNWQQCRAQAVDLSSFDADGPQGGSGVLEVIFCVTDVFRGCRLNLWYGEFPARKGFGLINDDEIRTGINPGCYVRYFRPEDARCAAYTQAPPGLAPTCVKPPDEGPMFYRCAGGRWGALDDSCRVAMNQAPLFVTVEFCSATLTGSVVVKSWRYLPEPCKCLSAAECIGGARCATVAAQSNRCPPGQPNCAGICTDAPQACIGL